MDIFFQDPSEVPLPPNEVRIREFNANPYADGQRVRIYLEVDPFQKRPSADLVVLNPEGNMVATASIIESMIRKIEVTLHLRGDLTEGRYTVKSRVYYTQEQEPEVEEPDTQSEPPEPEIEVVDQGEAEFQLPVES